MRDRKARRLRNENPQKVDSVWKRDAQMTKNLKSVEQKGEVIDFLEQYGMRWDRRKHHHFVMQSDLDEILRTFPEIFPKLYIALSENEKKNKFFRVYRQKDDELLMMVYIKNR